MVRGLFALCCAVALQVHVVCGEGGLSVVLPPFHHVHVTIGGLGAEHTALADGGSTALKPCGEGGG